MKIFVHILSSIFNIMCKLSETIKCTSTEISMLIGIGIGKEIDKEMSVEIFSKVSAALEEKNMENLEKDECLKIISKLFKNPEFHKHICRKFGLNEMKYQRVIAETLNERDYYQIFCNEYFK